VRVVEINCTNAQNSRPRNRFQQDRNVTRALESYRLVVNIPVAQ
jgi:hypothetical protein